MFVEKPVLRGRNARILPDFAAFLPSERPRPTGFTKALHGAGFGPGQLSEGQRCGFCPDSASTATSIATGHNTEIFHKLAELTSVQ